MTTIIVTGKDAQVTSRTKDHAQEKLSKLARYFNGIGKIEAVLGHSGDDAEVEVVISVPRGSPVVCHSRARDLYTAIDLVLDKAEAQLTRHKEKVKERKSPKAGDKLSRENDQEVSDDDEGLESYEDVIEKRDFN